MSSPVYPGEAITTRVWRDGNDVSFESVIAERGANVEDSRMAVLGAEFGILLLASRKP